MNRVWERILSVERPPCSFSHAFGRKSSSSSDLFRSIPFDPYIPRGEDTDYLINASQSGLCLFFDRELKIKHLHPERTGSLLSGRAERRY